MIKTKHEKKIENCLDTIGFWYGLDDRMFFLEEDSNKLSVYDHYNYKLNIKGSLLATIDLKTYKCKFLA